ncbi:M16 family metallopeptidase [Desulfobacula sp.]
MKYRQKYRGAAFKIVILCFLVIASCAVPRQKIVALNTTTPMDPDIVYGVLPNGFQYILKHNARPRNRVNIHLNVFSGSMNETNEQQGLAHYLEHMVFNGSEHFKPGELIEYFQSLGMDFGSDANASTSFFNTVFDLSLPKADYKYMDDAFIVIQDYAKGASLLESEVKREKGIILAEKRERDSVSYRTFKKSLAFELPDSLFNQRFPIGIDPVINKADRNLLKAYYDKWYRPDNMALIVVGDFDIKMVKSMIAKRFSKLKNGPLLLKAPLSTQWKDHKGEKPFYHYEPEASSTDITIETISWKPYKTQTIGMLKEKILIRMANSMIQNRLSRMVSRQTADFSEASVSSGLFLHNISMSSISATCEPDKWEKGLSQIEKALRQGLLYGFTKRELDRVKADVISFLELQVNQAATRKSHDLSRAILRAINGKKLLLSPKQRKDLLKPYIESISLEDAHKAFKKIWSKDQRLILVTGNAQINTQDPESTILGAYQKTVTDKIEKYQEFESGHFPYLELPAVKSVIVSKQENVKDLGITTIEFKNNVRLNLKKTDYKQNEFLFKVCFGEGRKSEPLSKPGLALLGADVLKKSGLGNLDSDQLEEALAGRKVSIGFGLNDNYFSLAGSSDPKEAELIFQLIYHYLNDPGYRAEALSLAKIRYRHQYDSLMGTSQGIMQIKGTPFLAGNDIRLGLPHPDIINQYTLDDIKNWMTPYFQNSPVEISIVGDFDQKNIIDLASKYAGVLKKRKKFSNESILTEKINFPKGKQIKLKPKTRIDSGVVRVAFLTDDFWNITQTRRLSILSRVFSERLRIIIREDLGETYSPYVYNDPSKRFPHYGVMHVVVNVKPGKQEFVYHKIKNIVESILLKGITTKETDLALKPVLNHLKVIRRTNGYWLNTVMANSSTYPEKFEWANTMVHDYNIITSDNLVFLAKKYLNFDDSAKIFIESEKSAD